MSAWNSLSGKWGKFAVIYLVYTLIIVASSMIFTPAAIILAGPLFVGLYIVATKVVEGDEDIEVSDGFAGFKNFGTTCGLYLLNQLFIFLWSLLFVIPGIVQQYAYSMSYFIIEDHPEMSITEARKESIRMMKGNKWRLFCLDFSFIGWVWLSSLTCGILMFWIMPYQITAHAVFYQDLKAREAVTPEVDAPATEA